MPLPQSLKSLKLPVVAAPMFLVSGPQLVIASCKAGILGTFPALNQRTSEGFGQWLTEIEKEVGGAPYGVNLIVHKSNPRVQDDLKLCVKHKVPVIITSLGAVPELVSEVHKYGGVVFHDITNLRHAQKAAQAGVDGLICVAAGAGGHAGHLSPFALVGQVRQFFDKTVLLAGALSHGQDILAAQALGADLAYMGTRFVATQESLAQAEYKQMILDSSAEDIVYTPAVSGIPANFMKPSLEKAGLHNFNDRGEMDFGANASKMEAEAKAWKTIWSAGHGVANINDIPTVSELVGHLTDEYKAARARL
jgi:nitronate monooxygenase